MTFEEAWMDLMGRVDFSPEQQRLWKSLACAFYKAGENQALQNFRDMYDAALAAKPGKPQ